LDTEENLLCRYLVHVFLIYDDYMIKGKIKWGIVGLGLQSEKIASAILSSSNGLLLSALSKDKKRMKSFAKQFSVPRFANGNNDLFHDPEIDAIFVASPNHDHYKHTLKALRAGKHVLCEKPMTITVREGRKMIQIAHSHNLQLGIGYYLRHHPIHQKAKDIIARGKLGKIILVEVNWSVGIHGQVETRAYQGYMGWRDDLKKSGGGALTARGTHIFDLIYFLTGKETDEIMAYTDISEHRSVDTLAVGMLKMKDESLALIRTSRRLPYSLNEVIIYGSHGRLTLHDALTTDSSGRLEFISGDKIILTQYPKKNVYQAEIEDFGDKIRGRQSPGAVGIDGLRSVAITKAFIDSSRTKRAISIKF
jgi:predicted dehydrogenase